MHYPWQQKQWLRFAKQQQEDHLPHALILSGPEGMGKNHFADVMVAHLLCQQGKACGTCADCLLLKAQTHPDRSEIIPDEKTHRIKIDQIREVVETLSKTTLRGGYRVCVIRHAQAMNHAAANALLKTLEEPGKKTLLLLTTHRISALSATIRSRCQIIQFMPDYNGTSLEWLTQQLGNEVDAKAWLTLAEAAPLRALELANKQHFKDFFDQLFDLGTRKADPIQLAQLYLDENLLELTNLWLSWLINWIRRYYGGENHMPNIASSALTDKLKTHHITAVFAFIDRLHEVISLLNRQANCQKQLLLESLFIAWTNLLIKGS